MEKVKKQKRNNTIVDAELLKTFLEDSDDNSLTLQEVGQIYGMTRMRICQIEKASLKKLSELDGLKELL